LTLRADRVYPILYSFRRCPYAIRARLALSASAQQCELREVVLREKPQEMLEVSPKGTVPVLVDLDGRVLDESLEIMRWALRRCDPERWLAPEEDSLETMLALIALFDDRFKYHLDRYKYPGRYEQTNPEDYAREHRTQGARYLEQLNAQLSKSPHLFGTRGALADMAIAPFVRQFEQTDRVWFERQPWPKLQVWLRATVSSERFICCMQKYPKWTSSSASIIFPPSIET
jgi:glutathione S-transferase